ncbi:MAG TPA: Zn-ribbon domain-containing OB-fold protein [Candidatus Binatia bacterium]|nr:Zn-ribbon domain-containing OB-fold protein [Candidatus Binatia bacterium]
MSYAKPLPEMTPAMRPFWDAARRRELVVQRCSGCGTARFPARDLCSRCLSREAEWVRASGRGSVFSWAVMHQVYHSGFAGEVPYAVVVVELEEGARLVSNLVDCAPDAITAGMPVEVVFEDVTPDVTLPKFRPAAAGRAGG